jgi:DNA replication and repair protein RecF
MRLKKISLVSFRNLQRTEFLPNNRFNLFYGDNAQGKTNLLESIYLLGTAKSFRIARNSDLVTWGETAGSITGWVDRDGITREIALIVGRQGKEVRVDQKAVTRASDFFGSLNTVIFSSDEMAMVKGQPEMRRKYLDRAIFSGDPTYLAIYHDYMRLLKHRNFLLRHGTVDTLDVWSEQLADAGGRLLAKRYAYLESIAPLLAESYQRIAGSDEEVRLNYAPYRMEQSHIETAGSTMLREALARTAEEERSLGTTVVGPHRDDLQMLLGGRILKQHASQGQQRSFVLALKMAEIEYIQRRFGTPPILLLDDMASELDPQRNRNLMDFLVSREMQVFITTTSLNHVQFAGMEHYSTFLVKAGVVHKQREQ